MRSIEQEARRTSTPPFRRVLGAGLVLLCATAFSAHAVTGTVSVVSSVHATAPITTPMNGYSTPSFNAGDTLNTVVFMITYTSKSTGGEIVSKVTFAGETMTKAVSAKNTTGLVNGGVPGSKNSEIYYLRRPNNASGVFSITTGGGSGGSFMYSALSLSQVGVAKTASAILNNVTSGSLSYSLGYPNGFVAAAGCNNPFGFTAQAPSLSSGNPTTTLYRGGTAGSYSYHLHCYGTVAAPGAYTDIYTVSANTALATLAFEPLVADIPPAPTGLTATTVSSSTIKLAWDAVATADSYNVYRSETSGGGYSLVASGVLGAAYSDTSCAAGTTYYYVVSAETLAGEGATGSEASAETSPPVSMFLLYN